ncbi:MAG: VWA domain-containing protein [Syntrophomonadaceae bacterium]|jgi:uncharacterized protein with von Willebrand factor type A (vWA) domain
MTFIGVLQEFFADLRREGIPVTFSQVEDCCRALMLVDWSVEQQFYDALKTTLVKEQSHEPAFASIYEYHFKTASTTRIRQPEWRPPVYRADDLLDDISGYAVDALPVQGMQSVRGGLSQATRNPLDQSFRLANLDDLHKMEALFPLIAKRLAARMIKKNRHKELDTINYRHTIRHSMATGGVPLKIVSSQKQKEKPIIIALCDVSGSVMTFSCFALALLSSLQRFFRQIRTFAFIEDIDEVTTILHSGNPLDLRTNVLENTRKIIGIRGFTNYGATFVGFTEHFGNILNHKTNVLIFGDGRNNWNNDQTWALKEIRTRARRIYWFNPEPEALWTSGDSRMSQYRKYCHKCFSCPNLSKLEQAIGQL